MACLVRAFEVMNILAGKMTISQDEIITITEIIDDLKNIKIFLPDRAFTKSFISVFLALRSFEEYDITQLLKGLDSNPMLTNELNDTGLTKAIIARLVNVFNNDGKVKRNRAIFAEATAYTVADANGIQWV